MPNPNKIPELKDIVEMIYRYNAVHKEGRFVFRFVGFKKDFNHKCEECGENCDEYDDERSLVGAYGDLDTLRRMLEELRDMIEDNADENGMVNVNEFGKSGE